VAITADEQYVLHESSPLIPHSSLHSLSIIMNVCMHVQPLTLSLCHSRPHRHIVIIYHHYGHYVQPSITRAALIHPSIYSSTYLPTYLPIYLCYLHTYLIILTTYLTTYQPIIYPSPTTTKDALIPAAEVNYHHQCCSWWHGYDCGCCDAAVHTL
jgi:hypothetical protein